MTPSAHPSAQDLLRELAPQVLGAVIRRFRDFAASEDAVQEALIAAATPPGPPASTSTHKLAAEEADGSPGDYSVRRNATMSFFSASVSFVPSTTLKNSTV